MAHRIFIAILEWRNEGKVRKNWTKTTQKPSRANSRSRSIMPNILGLRRLEFLAFLPSAYFSLRLAPLSVGSSPRQIFHDSGTFNILGSWPPYSPASVALKAREEESTTHLLPYPVCHVDCTAKLGYQLGWTLASLNYVCSIFALLLLLRSTGCELILERTSPLPNQLPVSFITSLGSNIELPGALSPSNDTVRISSSPVCSYLIADLHYLWLTTNSHKTDIIRLSWDLSAEEMSPLTF